MRHTDPLRHRRQWANFAANVKRGMRSYAYAWNKPHLAWCTRQLKCNGSARRFITLHASKN